ncbi:MAG: NAD-dependent epimerase/dehydratase family protein [Acidimicrobiia bacterium]
MRRVFVTGAGGWVGGQLIRRLSRRPDVEVFAVDDVPPKVEFNAPFQRLDLDRLALARHVLEVEPDVVIHLQSVHRAAKEDRKTESEDRIVGALALFGAIERLGTVQSVIVRSDAAIYGAGPRNPSLLKEETRPQGKRSRYQRDLQEMERFVAEVQDRHPGVTFTTLRFASIFGPNVGNALSRYLTLPVVPTLMGFDPRLQFTDERDAVSVLEHVLDTPRDGTFNVAGDGQIYLSRVLRLGRRLPQPLPGRLFDSALRNLSRANISVPGHIAGQLKHGRVIDTTRMRTELGFEPAHTCRQSVLNIYHPSAEVST